MFHQKWLSLLTLRHHKVVTELLIKAIIAPRTSFLKYLSLWHQLVTNLWVSLGFWNVCVSVDIADVVLVGVGGWTGDGDWSEELSKCWSWCSPKTGLGPFITCSMLKYRRQNHTWCHLLTPHTHPHPDKRTIDDKNTLCQISGASYNSQVLRVEIKSRLYGLPLSLKLTIMLRLQFPSPKGHFDFLLVPSLFPPLLFLCFTKLVPEDNGFAFLKSQKFNTNIAVLNMKQFIAYIRKYCTIWFCCIEIKTLSYVFAFLNIDCGISFFYPLWFLSQINSSTPFFIEILRVVGFHFVSIFMMFPSSVIL